MKLSKKELKALDKSIEHWGKDIVEKLQGDEIVPNIIVWASSRKHVPCYAEECALCQLVFNDCLNCLIYKFYKYDCFNKESAYLKFINNPCLKTARNMVKELQEIKEAAEEIEE